MQASINRADNEHSGEEKRAERDFHDESPEDGYGCCEGIV